MNVTNTGSGRRDFPLDLSGNGLPEWSDPLPTCEPLTIQLIGWRLDAGVVPEHVDVAIRGGVELAAWMGTIDHETRSAQAALQAEWDIDVALITADNTRTVLASTIERRTSPFSGAQAAYWSKGTGGRPGDKLNALRKRFYPFEAFATFDDVAPFQQDYRIEATVHARAAVKLGGMSNCNPTACGVFVDVRTNHRRASDPIDLFPPATANPFRSSAVYAFDGLIDQATDFDDLLDVLARWRD